MAVAQKRNVKVKEKKQELAEESVREESKKNGNRTEGVMHHVRYGAHCTLVVTERVISRLMDGYKSIFLVDNGSDANFHKEQGFAAFDKGDYEKSIQQFHAFLENTDKEDAEILYCLGDAYVNLEDYENGLLYLRKAEVLEPNDADIISRIGETLIKQEEYNAAIDYLKKGIEIVPDVVETYYMLGTAYEKTEKFNEATEMYKKAIDLNPKDPLYYHALGFVFESSGKHSEAIACFKKAMELEKNR